MGQQGEEHRTSRALIIVAKEPRAGQVKTRLGATLGHAVAAALCQAFISDTLRRAATLPNTTLAVAYWPPASADYFAQLKLPRLFGQEGADFGARLQHAFATMALTHQRLVLIGTDSPSLPASIIAEAFHLLDHHDVVLGPCQDGGWYLMGLRQPQPTLFHAIPWSTAGVYAATCQRISEAGLRLATLPIWYDIDTPGDLEQLYADLNTQADAEQSATLPLLRQLLESPARPGGCSSL